jgi:hypothetical protein
MTRPKPKPARARKPRAFRCATARAAVTSKGIGMWVGPWPVINADEAARLARWLQQAAAWMRDQEERRR